ncbi:MAG: hypothetical protein SGPRY_004943, partial [Prymnesium sp.]
SSAACLYSLSVHTPGSFTTFSITIASVVLIGLLLRPVLDGLVLPGVQGLVSRNMTCKDGVHVQLREHLLQ